MAPLRDWCLISWRNQTVQRQGQTCNVALVWLWLAGVRKSVIRSRGYPSMVLSRSIKGLVDCKRRRVEFSGSSASPPAEFSAAFAASSSRCVAASSSSWLSGLSAASASAPSLPKDQSTSSCAPLSVLGIHLRRRLCCSGGLSRGGGKGS